MMAGACATDGQVEERPPCYSVCRVTLKRLSAQQARASNPILRQAMIAAGVDWAVQDGMFQQSVRSVAVPAHRGPPLPFLLWRHALLLTHRGRAHVGRHSQKPIEFRLDAVANALQWPVSDLQYQLFRLQDAGDVTLRFDEWSFVVRVNPVADADARDVDAITTPLYAHMAQLETTQCVRGARWCACARRRAAHTRVAVTVVSSQGPQG